MTKRRLWKTVGPMAVTVLLVTGVAPVAAQETGAAEQPVEAQIQGLAELPGGVDLACLEDVVGDVLDGVSSIIGGIGDLPLGDLPFGGSDGFPIGDASSLPVGGFVDVVGSIHASVIECLAELGIMTGYPDGTFAPGDDVSRAQFASLLERVLEQAGVELPAGVQDVFGDDEGIVHEEAINRLAAAGLLSGSGLGEFSPQEALTRGQLASLLVAALESVGLDFGTVADQFVDDEGSVHEAAINRAAAAGIALGRSDLEFVPGDQLTRAQVSSFLARALTMLLGVGSASSG